MLAALTSLQDEKFLPPFRPVWVWLAGIAMKMLASGPGMAVFLMTSQLS